MKEVNGEEKEDTELSKTKYASFGKVPKLVPNFSFYFK